MSNCVCLYSLAIESSMMRSGFTKLKLKMAFKCSSWLLQSGLQILAGCIGKYMMQPIGLEVTTCDLSTTRTSFGDQSFISGDHQKKVNFSFLPNRGNLLIRKR